MGIHVADSFRGLLHTLHNRHRDAVASVWLAASDGQHGLDETELAPHVGARFEYVGDGQVSYVPANRWQAFRTAIIDDGVSADDAYTRFAQTVKLGRVTRALVNQATKSNADMGYYGEYMQYSDLNITDSMLETFVNRVKANGPKVTDRWWLVSGDDIMHYYDGNNYHDNRNVGDMHSCMSSAHNNEYMQVYADNPHAIRMLVLVDTETTDDVHDDNRAYHRGWAEALPRSLARGLVWQGTNEHGQNVHLLDRVYGAHAAQIAARDLALSLGIYVYSDGHGPRHNGRTSHRFVNQNDDGFNRLTVQLHTEIAEYTYLPYVDTCAYANFTRNTLSTSSNGDYDVELRCTGGQPHHDYLNREDCVECGDRHNFDGMHYAESRDGYLCDSCYGHGLCRWCGGYFGDEIIVDEINDRYCGDCFIETHCETCGTYVGTNGLHGWCTDCYHELHCTECDEECTPNRDGLCTDCAAGDDKTEHTSDVSSQSDGQVCQDCGNGDEPLCSACAWVRQTGNGAAGTWPHETSARNRGVLSQRRLLLARADGSLPTTCHYCRASLSWSNRVGTLAQCRDCWADVHCQHCASARRLNQDHTRHSCDRCDEPRVCSCGCGRELTTATEHETGLYIACYRWRQMFNGGQRSLVNMARDNGYRGDTAYAWLPALS